MRVEEEKWTGLFAGRARLRCSGGEGCGRGMVGWGMVVEGKIRQAS